MHHQEEGWNRIAPETSHPAALGAGARVPWPRLPSALASLSRAGQGGGVFRASPVGAVQRKRHNVELTWLPADTQKELEEDQAKTSEQEAEGRD